MHYVEKIIDGVLCRKPRLGGEWEPVESCGAGVVNLLAKLTDAERMNVFSHFCTNCGDTDPSCQCWNDE